MWRSASLYYTDIAKTDPVTDPEEERRLIHRWQQHRDVRARDTLIQGHLRFVVSVARKRTKDNDRLPDIIAAGNLGLLKAADRYDLDHQPATRFLTYAGWWIQKEIADEDYASCSVVHVPNHRKKAQRRQARAFQRAVEEHGPEAPEVLSMNPGTPDGETVSMSPGPCLPGLGLKDAWGVDVEDPAPLAFHSASANLFLRRAIAKLPLREQTVLNLYFGVKDDPRSLSQIATILEVHPERVRQLKVSGMEQLRVALGKRDVSSTSDAY